MGGVIRIMSGEYFLDSFIHLHVDDVVNYGDGYNRVILLQHPYVLGIRTHAQKKTKKT